MSVYEFLNEATANAFLKKVRQETQPTDTALAKNDPEGPEAEDQLEELQVVEADETEDVGDLPTDGYPKKPKRRSSKSLTALLMKYEDRVCDATDTGCLQQYMSNQIFSAKSFDFPKTEAGQTRLRLELKKLSQIVHHMYYNTLTLRAAFVTYTGMFKRFIIDKYPGQENQLSGFFVDVVRATLRGEESRVKVALDEKSKRLREKLDDKFTEDYEDIEQAILTLYGKGMDEGASRKDVIGLLVAIETSCGTRKGGIVDPNVAFYTWDQWQALKKRTGLPQPKLGFGMEDDPEAFMEIDQVGFEDVFDNPMKHCIVQQGILKSKSEAINKYLSAGDNRWVQARSLTKPCLVLSAAEVVQGVRRFRTYFDLKKSTFRGRRIEANNFGSVQIRPIMEQYFQKSFAKANARGWAMGTHHGRRCWGVACWEIYGEKVQQVTGKYVDRSRFMSKVLGHDPNSLNTYLSYNTVVVSFRVTDKIFETPPEEQMRTLNAKIASQQSQIAELRTMVVRLAAMQGGGADNSKFASFLAHDPPIFLLKSVNRNYKTTRNRDLAVKAVVDRLIAAGLEASDANVGKMGIGRGTYTDYKNNIELGARKPANKRKSSAVEELPTVVPRELQNDSVPAQIVVPVGTRVVPKRIKTANQTNTNYKRDVARFGAENVVDVRDGKQECAGDVVVDQIIENPRGKDITRDLCVDKR